MSAGVELQKHFTTNAKAEDYNTMIANNIDANLSKMIQEKYTELWLAEHFIKEHGKDLHYCEKKGWLVWDGKRWLPDSTKKVEQRAIKTIRGLHLIAIGFDDSADRDRLQKFARESEYISKIKSLISLAACVDGVAVELDVLDSHPKLLNMTNGTIDLGTGELLPHNRKHLLTKITKAAYHKELRSENVDKLINGIFPDPEIRSYVQRTIGSSLIGLVYNQVVHIWKGDGSNGKSTLGAAIVETLGNYACNLAPKMLIKKKYEAHLTELAMLRGIRFAICIEIGKEEQLDEEKVKRLSGNDHITARRMYENLVEFEPSHTIFIGANHNPRIKGRGHAIWRRMKVSPFTATFSDNKDDLLLSEKLKDEHDALFTWMMDGYLEYQKDEYRLLEPDVIIEATAEYKNKSNSVKRFIDQKCTVGQDADGKELNVGAIELHRAYQIHANDSNEMNYSQTQFGREIKNLGYRKGQFGNPDRRTHYFGLALLDSQLTGK